MFKTMPMATVLIELQKMRAHQYYRFQIFDQAFFSTYSSVEEFLHLGRNMLMSSIEMSEKRLVLAKVYNKFESIILYVDRDYYELVKRTRAESKHLCSWQFATEWKGCKMEDLEYMMGKLLYKEAKPHDFEVSGPRPKQTVLNKAHKKEFWQEGSVPYAVAKVEESIERDFLI